MLGREGTKRLETGRLILRRFSGKDEDGFLHDLIGDREVTRYLPLCEVTPEQARRLLRHWIETYDGEPSSLYQWAVELRATGELIGTIGATVLSEEDAVAEIGYFYARRFWGKGYATEALREALRYLLLEAGFHRVEARHAAEHAASGRVLRKAGMLPEGRLRRNYRCSLGYCDSCLYGILRSDMAPETPNHRNDGPPIHIRRAREDDYESIASLEEEVYALHLRGRPDLFRADYRFTREDYGALLTDHDTAVLAACADESGDIVAICILKRLDRAGTVFNPFVTLYIDDFCVAEKWRGQGIGRLILGSVREQAKKMNAKNIELNVWNFNDKAVAFYNAMGFAVQRERLELPLDQKNGASVI